MLGDFLSFLWWIIFLLASQAPPGKYSWISISRQQVHSDPPGLATVTSSWPSGCPAVVTGGGIQYMLVLGEFPLSVHPNTVSYGGEFWPIITIVTTTTTMHIQLHLHIGNSRGSNKTIIFSFVTIMYLLLLNWLVLLQSYCNNMSKVYLLRCLTNHLFHICRCFHLESPSMVQFWSNSDSEELVCYREWTCCREAKAGDCKCLAEFTKLFGTWYKRM